MIIHVETTQEIKTPRSKKNTRFCVISKAANPFIHHYNRHQKLSISMSHVAGSFPRTPRTPSSKRMSMLVQGSGFSLPTHKRSNSFNSGSTTTVPVQQHVHEPNDDHSNNIKVICRVRPLNINEINDVNNEIITFPDEDSVTIRGRDLTQNFTYDKVFGSKSSQAEVYDYTVKQTVQEVLNGYNGTILAYGQTGSGKSFTMLGPSINDELSKGLIPRISDEIFEQIRTNGSNEIEYTVSLSIMEIYLEQINDLLVEDNKKLSIHEDIDNGVYVKGLSHAFISNTRELYKLLKLGIKNRASNITNMNMESSRSHAIFQLKLHQKNLKDESIKKSNLFLIDLAGSEKVDRTGAVGQTLKEAKNINSSLSALGNVIYTLTDNKSTHIPYRDSKLTRILQESLGGNSRTTLILTISPSSQNELETLSTLRFGSRAKAIKNKAHINQELSASELKFRLKKLERINEQNKLYIEKLENQLNTDGSDFSPRILTHTDRDFESKIPVLRKSSVSPPRLELFSKLQEKEQKIKNLEEELLNYKINSLKILNEEEVKLNKLEKALFKLSEKLNDVEVININLRKHLMISEKVIDQRDQSIQYLNKLLNEQQFTLNNQTATFEDRLSRLRSRINDHKSNDLHLNITKSPNTPSSPRSPYSGLNLKIIKPIIGGNDDSEEEDYDENVDRTF